MPSSHTRRSERRDERGRARGDAQAHSKAPIRILIVDAHAMFAQGLARLLDDEPDLRSVGFARTIEEGTGIAERTEPGLVLLDIQLHRREASGGGTVEVAGALHISPLTVRSHVKNILFKLGVHSKLEAVTLAIRGGLVRLDRTA